MLAVVWQVGKSKLKLQTGVYSMAVTQKKQPNMQAGCH